MKFYQQTAGYAKGGMKKLLNMFKVFSFMFPNVYFLGISGVILDYDPSSNPLFIHFQHEGYKPRLLERLIRPTEEEQS